MAESLRDTIRAALTEEALNRAWVATLAVEGVDRCGDIELMRAAIMKALDPALDAWEQTQREALEDDYKSRADLAIECARLSLERDASAARVTELEGQLELARLALANAVNEPEPETRTTT